MPKLTVQEWRDFLPEIDKRNDPQWLEQLEERKRLESEFHDYKHKVLKDAKEKAEAETPNAPSDTYDAIFTNRKYYRAVEGASNYMADWIATESKDRIFLDYCCGIGGNSIKAAKAGAALSIGIDISENSLNRAKAAAEAEGVGDRCIFILGDAENTRLPDNSIERGVCSGVLHHLDLSFAVPELRRVAAPGARFLAGEALDYNPAIKLYRMMTPGIRTEWEKAHILSLKDVKFTRRFFDVQNIRYWHITAIAGPHLPGNLQPMLNGLDRVLEKIPLLQLMAWMFTYEMVKPEDDKAS